MKRNFTNKKKNMTDMFCLLQNEQYYQNQLLNILNDPEQDNTIDSIFKVLVDIDPEILIEQLVNIYPKIYVIKNQVKVLDKLKLALGISLEDVEAILSKFYCYLEIYSISPKIECLTSEEKASLIIHSLPKLIFKDFYADIPQATYCKQVLLALQLNDTLFLDTEVALIKEKQHLQQSLVQLKLINNIIQKARRQLRASLKLKDNKKRVLEIKENTLFKLKESIEDTSLLTHESIIKLIEDINNILYNQELMLPAIIYFHYQEKQGALYNQDDLEIIIEFYNQHHLYLKLKQIKKELTKNPLIIDYFKQYIQASLVEDINDKINQLDILIEDINIQNHLKKLETVTKLLSVTKKEVELLINEDQIINTSTNVSVNNANTPRPEHIITIGGFSLDVDSVRANPDTLETLMPLINLESETQKEVLNRLMYEIGFDKLRIYLQKQPNLTINSLLWIVRIDRLLRYQYQDLLEGVELYFRSSFTQYLSNKYDEIYDVIGIKGKHFYYRGYLRNYVFDDNDLHYENIKKLNTRIDNEMAANNQQLIDEFKECKYAISFSTAAGLMTFGWLIGIFQNLVLSEKKSFLNKYFGGLMPQTFNAWIVSLNNLRNKCAHYQCLYRLSSMKELRPIMTKIEDQVEFDDLFAHHSFFYYTLIAVRLSPNDENVRNFIASLENLFNKAMHGNYSFNLELDYSFPNNWQYYLNNQKGSRTMNKS